MNTCIIFWDPVSSPNKLKTMAAWAASWGFPRSGTLTWEVGCADKLALGDRAVLVMRGKDPRHDGVVLEGEVTQLLDRDGKPGHAGHAKGVRIATDYFTNPMATRKLTLARLARAVPSFPWRGACPGGLLDPGQALQFSREWLAFNEEIADRT